MPEPLGTPLGQSLQDRAGRRRRHQRQLDLGREQRREDEQTPHAVHDRGNAGEQLHGRADRPPQELGAEFHEEEGDRASHGQSQGEGQGRGDQGSNDRPSRAVDLLDRIPGGDRHEADPEPGEGRPTADRQGDQHAAKTGEQGGRRGEAQRAKDGLERRAARPGAAAGGGDRHRPDAVSGYW